MLSAMATDDKGRTEECEKRKWVTWLTQKSGGRDEIWKDHTARISLYV